MKKNFIFLLGAQIFVSFGGLTIPPLIPFIQPELTLTYTEVGSIMTFLYLGAMIISLPAGWLTDKLGVKKTIFLSQILMGSFVAVFSFVGNYLIAILTAFVMGLGYGMVNPPTTKEITILFRREKRGFAMSAKQTGVPIGGAIAAGLLPPLAFRFSWKISFLIAGIIIILSGLLFQIFYTQSQEKVSLVNSSANNTPKATLGKTFHNKNTIILGIGGAFCSLVQIALITYIIFYLRDVKKFDLLSATFCLTLINIGGICGRIFWGLMSDWLFKGSRKEVLKLIISLIFLSSLILGLNIPLPLVLLFFVLFLFGFSAVGWNGVYHAFIGELPNKEMIGRTVGLSMTIVFTGNLLGPLLFGKIIDVTSSYSIAWYFLCIVMAVAFILISMVREEA